MTQIVYTMGYAGKSLAEIRRLAEELDATLCDVRFSPRSRNPQFSGQRLAEALGERYVHLAAFGNRNYKGGPVDVVDYAAGKSLVAAHPRPVILLCVCREAVRCHRTVIARQLAQEGFTVRELDEPPGATQPRLL